MVRADAQRNRDQILRVAREEFARGRSDVTLDQIARAAGVGIGTLYRGFPTRESLVEAVYRDGLDEVCAAADQLLAELPPAEALRAWMDRYAVFVGTKRGMAESLRAMRESGVLPADSTVARIHAAIGRLLDAGVADGTLREGIRPDDVATTLIGILWSTARDTVDEDALRRMLDLLFAGLRRTPTAE